MPVFVTTGCSPCIACQPLESFAVKSKHYHPLWTMHRGVGTHTRTVPAAFVQVANGSTAPTCVPCCLLLQVYELQSKLSCLASAEARLQAHVQDLATQKTALGEANQQLQQALTDKALEATAALESLRQQHAKQLAAIRLEQQQQLEQMRREAAAQDAQHKQVSNQTAGQPAAGLCAGRNASGA